MSNSTCSNVAIILKAVGAMAGTAVQTMNYRYVHFDLK